jgi:hypothetical protein
MSEFGSISQGGKDVFPGQLRIVVDNVFERQALGSSIQDHGNFDSRVAAAGPPAANLGIDCDTTLIG